MPNLLHRNSTPWRPAAFAALFLALPLPTLAENGEDRPVWEMVKASHGIHAACLMSAREDGVPAQNMTALCACANGYLGGHLSDKDYIILGYVSRIMMVQDGSGSEDELTALALEFQAAGFTREDMEAILARLEEIDQRADIVCAPYQVNKPAEA